MSGSGTAMNLISKGPSKVFFSLTQVHITWCPYILIINLLAGPFRGMMQKCYHRECDTARSLGVMNGDVNIDYNFLAMTVQTVIDSVVSMSGAQCSLSSRSK